MFLKPEPLYEHRCSTEDDVFPGLINECRCATAAVAPGFLMDQVEPSGSIYDNHVPSHTSLQQQNECVVCVNFTSEARS